MNEIAMPKREKVTKEERIEFLKHVRNIHFAMLIAAATILLAMSGSNVTYKRALDQLRDLSRLTTELAPTVIRDELLRETKDSNAYMPKNSRSALHHSITNWIDEYLWESDLQEIDFNAEFDIVSVEPFVELDNIEREENYQTWFETGLCLLAAGEKLYRYHKDFSSERLDGLDEKQSHLDRILKADKVYSDPYFAMSFDHLERGPNPMGTILAAATKELSERLQDDDKVSLSAAVESVKLTDRDSRQSHMDVQIEADEDPHAYTRYEGGFDIIQLQLNVRHTTRDRSSFTVKFPLPVMFKESAVKFVPARIKNLPTAQEVFPRYEAGARTCVDLFPELFEVTEFLRTAKYDDLEKYLEAQVKRHASPITIVGLEIDRDLISYWGVIVLLCMHFYFCLHYTALIGLTVKSNIVKFPWIGLYRSRAALIVFFSSIALPSGICIVMICRGGSGEAGIRIYFLLFALALLIWNSLLHVDALRSSRTNYE